MEGASSLWRRLAPSVVIVLKTGAAVLGERMPHMLEAYATHVPNLLVISDAPAPPVEAGRPPVLDVLHDLGGHRTWHPSEGAASSLAEPTSNAASSLGAVP